MKNSKSGGKGMKIQRTLGIRASISFPAALYKTLEVIAKQKKVSMAWVVRDAAERYVVSEAKGAGRKI